jgi:hypothetical protein
MLKNILLGLVAIIAVILIIAAFKSPDFRVERSRVIAAPADVLFAQVNDHRKFNTWNPWLKMDPAAKVSYRGPEAGVDAVSSWEGEKTGKGSATITESKPGELVRERMGLAGADGGREHGGFHVQGRRRQDDGDVGDVWKEQLHGPLDVPVYEHGRNLRVGV